MNADLPRWCLALLAVAALECNLASAAAPAAPTAASAAGSSVAGPANAALSPPLAIPAAEEGAAADWAATLERIAGSVVAIQIDQARAFDTERNVSAQATGFVVDAERGLILTNRHVVTPGPVTAEATFLNREEGQLYPGTPTPGHNSGFFPSHRKNC